MESSVLNSDGEEMGRDVVEVGRWAHETRGQVWQPCEGIGVGSGWDGPKPKEAWAAANETAIKTSLGQIGRLLPIEVASSAAGTRRTDVSLQLRGTRSGRL